MKMSKFRIAVLVLLAVTVIYGVSLTLVWWRYNQEPTESYDERLGHYLISRKPFLNSRGGLPYFWAGVVLTLMWLVLGTGRKKMVTVTLLLLLILPTFSLINAVSAEESQPFIRVGVLCAEDEEFMASWITRDHVENVIDYANSVTAFAVLIALKTLGASILRWWDG